MRSGANSRKFCLEMLLQLSPSDAWDLFWRTECQRLWLGADSQFDLRVGSRLILSDAGAVWRTGKLLGVVDLREVRIQLEVPANWLGGPAFTSLTIRFSEKPELNGNPSCLVRVEESPIPLHYIREVKLYWRERQQRLRQMDETIRKRRANPRQAVLLIHGIGEQQPGEILNGFLSSGVLGNKKWGTWVKPDHRSELLEMRKATLNGDQDRPTTDVYELYWAHLIRDTTLAQVTGWLRRLLFRSPFVRSPIECNPYNLRWTIPPKLTPLWLLVWAMVLVMAGILLGRLLQIPWLSWIPLWMAVPAFIAPVLGPLLKYFGLNLFTNFLGDAARYLRPHPDNIKNRQEIRSQGVSMLEKLHKAGTYDRIVVVGHSLGSVIAYDILSHAWGKMHRAHHHPITRPRFDGDGPFQSQRRVERAAAERRHLISPEEAQRMQNEAWQDLRINTQPWLVTDLVTLGSPLTYADFLLAEGGKTTTTQKRNRTLPICPPWMEKVKPFGARRRQRPKPCPALRFSFEGEYLTNIGQRKSTFSYYHHAALFAVTRWSNIYVPTNFLGLGGDLISGPLGKEAGGLGKWIRDVKLKRKGLWMHTWYWNPRKGDGKQVEALKKVMDLNVRQDLNKLLQEIPAFLFLSHEA